MSSAASALKLSGIGGVVGQGVKNGIGMVKSVFGGNENQQAVQTAGTQAVKTSAISANASGMALPPNLKNKSALQTAAGQPALPQAPAMLARKQGQKSREAQTGQQGISIDLTQNFDLITQDAAAARKVLEAVKPEMEALIRRALAKIASDKRRTAYAQ